MLVEFLTNLFNDDEEFCTVKVDLVRIFREPEGITGLISLHKAFPPMKTAATLPGLKRPTQVAGWHIIMGCHLPSNTLLKSLHPNRLPILTHHRKGRLLKYLIVGISGS